VKRHWKVQRSLVKRSDAQRRWDIAYQRLLQWTNEMRAEPTDGSASLMTTQEVKDESCPLYPCLDFAATTEPNH